ncbi:MAG: histidine phosphatase family protein [Planctomycetota bacterium]
MLTEVTDFCRLFLLRHPELSEQHAALALGSGDASLSRRGKSTLVEWLKLVSSLEIDAIYAADQLHCRDAASAIGATKGLEVQAETLLKDQELGRWQGKRWEDLAAEEPDRVREFFADFGEITAPDGESLGQAVERFLEWWNANRQPLLGKTALLVTSGAMLTGFSAAMLGMRLSRAVCLNLPYGGLGVLDIYDNGARISSWNPTALSGLSSSASN